VIWAYRQAGVGGVARPLDPWAPAVYEATFTDPALLLPGDVVWVRRSERDTPHVGLFAGGGVVIHAANTSRGIVEEAMDTGYFNYYGRVAAGYWPAGDNGYNHPPRGYLDTASCDVIGGWAQDPDAPHVVISVHVYADGPAGSGTAIAAAAADGHRPDLCDAIGSCEHAYHIRPPRGILDSLPHPIYVYGIDASGAGPNSLLTNSPRTLQCDPPDLPLDPRQGLLRWVRTQEIFSAWRFSSHDVLVGDDAILDEYDHGPDFPDAPSTATATHVEGRIYLLDGDMRRWITNQASFVSSHPSGAC